MINTEMGEYLVGAWLKLIKSCDFVDYNVRRPGGKLKGLDELDVIGLDFHNKIAYLCEVTTHLDGLLIGAGQDTTVKKVADKYIKQKSYAVDHLSTFDKHVYMFWSPKVSLGLEDRLKALNGLELVINKDYTKCVQQLQQLASTCTYDAGNPVFRIFQILQHLQ